MPELNILNEYRCIMSYPIFTIIILYTCILAQFMLREDIFTVIEGDPGDDTLVLIIVDIVDGTPDIQLNFTVSSNATSM